MGAFLYILLKIVSTGPTFLNTNRCIEIMTTEIKTQRIFSTTDNLTEINLIL